MTWSDFTFLLPSADPALVELVGAFLAAAAVAAVLFLMGRRRRAVKLRLLKGTARDRMNADGAERRVRRSPQIEAIVASIEKQAMAQDPVNSKTLRAQLRQAGFFAKSTLAYFIAIRVLAALAGAGTFYAAADMLDTLAVDPLYAAGAGLACGYLGPRLALNRRVNRLQTEHRNGFPDMMDLMVVCAQAGLSMEATIQKIGVELSDGYPSLSRHLELTSLELRNGRSMSQAVEALAQRLGIDEASSFATLLQQSEQLGASISDSLRAFSDDMRNKRLMKAEERAYALPTKLVVPLTLFVFPVLIVVLLLPVAVAVSVASS